MYVDYTLTLSVHDRFTALQNFGFSVTGLPDGTSWKLELVSYKIDESDMAMSVYNLVIKVEASAPTGLFLFTVTVNAQTTGGAIIARCGEPPAETRLGRILGSLLGGERRT